MTTLVVGKYFIKVRGEEIVGTVFSKNAPLLIIGASARAAATSARRQKLPVFAADLFADADLAKICPVTRLNDLSDELLDVMKQSNPAAWMYCGGLENRPRLVDLLSKQCPLLGNDGRTIRQVRNPNIWTKALEQRQLTIPKTRITPPECKEGWLRKPRRSGGGIGVGRFVGKPRRGDYYQQYLPGMPISALFAGGNKSARLVGICQQLVGEKWCGAKEFLFSGAIGPLNVKDGIADQLRRIGSVLASEFSLRGLFGIDAILSEGDVATVEINPRYTASAEVLEMSLGVNMVGLHLAAYGEFEVILPASASPSNCRGKAILYATSDVVFKSDFLTNLDSKWIADIPVDGTSIGCGEPLMTLFGEAASPDQVLRCLKQRAAKVYQACQLPPPLG